MFKENEGIHFLECDPVKRLGVTISTVPLKMKKTIINDLNELLKDWKHDVFAKYNIEKLIWYTEKTEFSDKDHKDFKSSLPMIDQYKKTDIKILSPKFEELLNYE